MGKSQKKTGKGRLDKYYRLAKEQGYRARSAFKLVQLNKKYGFLESAKCCIDLCAAPGGWLQVASKSMPANSIIVGVDLVPIRPIPRVTTFAADITTSRCRDLIRNELKDWKADVVLHDGAPNVGAAWVQDAYSQSELVLMSLKLAVEFLMKGGTFVTKVFRSADYNNLLWVFGQLFGRVEATKPPSSRNVSAEIFVVCRDYLAPTYVDPKFLDPKHAFKDVTSAPGAASTSAAQMNVFKPEVKRRKRDGYEDGDYILFKRIPAKDFVHSSDPISILSTANQIVFEGDDKEWLQLDMTTPDVASNFQDLRVLGKGEFKALLKWRTSLRKYLALEGAPEDKNAEPAVVDTPEDEEATIQADLEKLEAQEKARLKRDRRKANEHKTRSIRRMQLQMTAPMDIGMEQHDQMLQAGQDEFLHGLGQDVEMASDDGASSDGSDAGHSVASSDISQNRALEGELDALYDEYNRRKSERDAKFRAQEMRKKNKLRDEEWHGIDEDAGKDSDSDGGESGGPGGWDYLERMKEDNDYSEDTDSDSEGSTRPRKRQRQQSSTRVVQAPAQPSRTVQQWFGQDLFNDIDDDMMDEDNASVEQSIQVDDLSDEGVWSDIGEVEEVKPLETLPKRTLSTPQAVTLAQELINRRTTVSRLVDEGFNRLAFNDKDDLPRWFLDDEATHYKPNIPVTKQAMDALRARQRALDARPIKKVAEAKARKKMKAAQQLSRAAKKAEAVNDNSDLTEREKALQIQKLMAKGQSKSAAQGKRKEIKVVVAKGTNRGVKGRPRGVKGKYLMVDSRMKKEMRANKRKNKSKR